MALSLDEGRAAVRLARRTLESHVRGTAHRPGPRPSGVLSENRGVFVTLNLLVGDARELRGCIGYPEPIKPLWEAVQDVTVYASEDPRFPHPVSQEELDGIVVEVSVLTLPQEIRALRRQDLPSKIRLGVDGLVVSNSFTSGLFLPQVATEQGWDQETFLSEACGKAGLPFDSWLKEDTKVEVFQAEVFAETSPAGEVVQIDTTDV
ncbi:MAG TPA: TIGR00296 family protein [Nitrososphaerales archaeon]|nr:TIGR00296 family protein [Nitrososphaerales archaeon]